jgi:hypothetical protein
VPRVSHLLGAIHQPLDKDARLRVPRPLVSASSSRMWLTNGRDCIEPSAAARRQKTPCGFGRVRSRGQTPPPSRPRPLTPGRRFSE